MKKRYINTALLALVLSFGVSACMDPEINTDVYGVTDAEYNIGGLSVGSPFIVMQTRVIPIGSPSQTTTPGNDLQNTDLISSGAYVGFFGNNNNWNNTTEATWSFTDNRMEYAYKNLYTNTYTSWLDIKQAADKSMAPKDLEAFAMAEIVKITTWLRATDAFGPIPYSDAGTGNITPKLDAQEKVYELMLEDLKKAVETLKRASGKTLEKYDLIYNGDTSKWIKFANSLMLRMGVRVHFVKPDLARDYIAYATDPANGGLIETVADEAKIGDSGKYPLLNPMIASIDYDETKMGMTIWQYLTGYNDPRMSQWFNKTAGNPWRPATYVPIAPVNPLPKRGDPEASKPNVEKSDPVYWLKASEVQFLLAEASLYGFVSGDPKSYYEKGVALAFEEAGVGGVDSYLSQDNALPATMETNQYLFQQYGSAGFYSSNLQEGNVSPKWNDGADAEKKLQAIITQKFLALYPNGMEAWTEYRRTGYPFIAKPYDPIAQKNIECESCLVPERFKFASTENAKNPNMSEVPTLLGGPDTGATRLWWVRPDRPAQP